MLGSILLVSMVLAPLFASAAVSALVCTFNGKTITSGSSVTAYQSSTVPYGSTCASQSRKCTNGSLSGSYAYASCSVAAPLSCTFTESNTGAPPGIAVPPLSKSVTVASGSSVTVYQNYEVAYGQSCVSQTRTCTNGSLSGSYVNPSCRVAPPASCTFSGNTVASGSSVTAYQSVIVPYGYSCLSQTRTCTNGTLSGSYTYPSCSVTAPISCTFNGNTVASGSSVTAYQIPVVPYGSTCAAISQTRTCTNKSLPVFGLPLLRIFLMVWCFSPFSISETNLF